MNTYLMILLIVGGTAVVALYVAMVTALIYMVWDELFRR